ncbi:MAG: carbohydrate ABC transporter substrate-binding protein [Lachnospiraceae bacterium]|nr:carbohydrate ABC transporter substrate-binding protein [Lachnospiraceae bacterium]
MKMGKKVLGLTMALATVAALGLTGCGKEDSGKITIFQSKTEIMSDLNALAKAYTEETGVEVEVWETTGDNYYSDLKTGLSTEAGATLFSLQPGAESVELADYLADLGDLSFVGKIGAGMADEVNGKIVGIPYTVEGFGLIYDKDLVDPASLNSTQALLDFMANSTADNALGLSQEDYFLIAHILNAPFAVQSNPEGYLKDVLAGSTRLADNEAFQEFAQIMEGIRANCTNPVDITYDNNCGDFATGKTALIHQGNWASGMFADYDVTFDMGITAVPIQGNNKISVSVPIAWYLNADASEKEQKLAKDFLEWLYTSKTGVDYLMNKFNFIPVVDGMENTNLDPVNTSVSNAVISGNTIPWVMSDWPAGIVSTDLAPITKEFFTSDMTGTELLDKLNDAFVAAAN